jgi:broad specificity phosphatase PhoE
MELIFVRHGEPVAAQTDDGSPANPHLSERGVWQASRVCDWLACEPIDTVITSNKRRAQQTVEALAEGLNLTPNVVHDFDEIDRNCPVYAPFQMMSEHFPDYWQKILKQQWTEIGWDSPEVFRERVIAAYEGVVASRPGERVVIGCHGGVIGAVLAHVIGVESMFTFANVPFASITRLRVQPEGGATVGSMCEVAHFDATRSRIVGPDGEGFSGTGFTEGLKKIEAAAERQKNAKQ